MCDLIIDHATLEAMLEAGKKSGEKIIEEYAQTAVAIADIKIAVRSQKTGKMPEFMKKSNGKLFRDQCGSADTGSIGRCGGDRTVSGRNILS